ncbi:MAG: GNAT family N-acetyltransferase [Pseudomonadales bacterium]|nr:GNAT family N-acetyltransferase [Pseudomonadales bacterium]
MYELIEEVASVEDFIRLRKISGLSPRPKEAVEKGLPNSLYGVQILHQGKTIGMGRVIGDGAINFEIVDIAVDPEHQRQGLGSRIMKAIMNYVENTAYPGSYIDLMADVPELYVKFGFKLTRPGSEGMYYEKK